MTRHAQTLTERRILALWTAHPGSRARRRMAELRRLVKRDLECAARRNRRAAGKGRGHG